MKRIVLAGLATMALAAPAAALPMASETPGTAAAQKEVEIGRSITDPDEYLAFV